MGSARSKALVLSLLLVMVVSGTCRAASTFVPFGSKDDFAGFALSHARWDASAGGFVYDASAPGRNVGGLGRAVVESPEVPVEKGFNNAVASWNAYTPAGSYLTIYLRVREGGSWSNWYQMALWNMDNKVWHKTTIPKQRDSFGSVAQETLKLSSNADAFQVRAQLESTDGRAYPTLRFIAVNCNDTSIWKEDMPPVKEAWGKELDIPFLCQLSVPGGWAWCSPTSTAMVLRYWAKKLNRPEMVHGITQAANNTYDEDYGGTGTWSFNTAWAGEFKGMHAYVTRYTSVSQAEQWIARGVPVILALNAIGLYTGKNDPESGHLVVLRGFTAEGNPIFNDPWAILSKGEKLRKTFPRANLENAWLGSGGSFGTAYIIYPESLKF